MRDVVEDGPVEGRAVGAGLGAGEEFGGRGHSIFRGAPAPDAASLPAPLYGSTF
jgi:hypothetical protein